MQANSDIRLSGHVSSVGRSSIETTVWLEQEQHGQWMKLTSAVFLMAARNTTISGSAPVNKLVPADDEEKLILAEANRKFIHDKLSFVYIYKFPIRSLVVLFLFKLPRLFEPT